MTVIESGGYVADYSVVEIADVLFLESQVSSFRSKSTAISKNLDISAQKVRCCSQNPCALCRFSDGENWELRMLAKGSMPEVLGSVKDTVLPIGQCRFGKDCEHHWGLDGEPRDPIPCGS